MATITGKLEMVTGGSVEAGSVEVALCGYGSSVPRGAGLYLFARPENEIEVDANGEFSFVVSGNDQVQPPGTYYTVTVKDANGDIVQVNAYIFLGGNEYDLNVTEPFNPTEPPPPLPPLITNLLLILSATDVMNFPGDTYTAFKVTLPGNVTNASISGMVPGNLYTFIILQEGTGGWRFVWPPNVYNGARVDMAPNSTTIQTFVADEFGHLYAIGPATYYP